jgi:uncharacterized protein YegJ (DUF2314 family)
VISDISFDGTQFEGVLGNEPIYIQKIHLGDHVVIQMKDISDRIIIDDGKLLGGFIIYVLRSKMSESERKKFDRKMELLQIHPCCLRLVLSETLGSL